MPVMSRPTMRACMVSMPSKVWMASARLHRFADIRDTRSHHYLSSKAALAVVGAVVMDETGAIVDPRR